MSSCEAKIDENDARNIVQGGHSDNINNEHSGGTVEGRVDILPLNCNSEITDNDIVVISDVAVSEKENHNDIPAILNDVISRQFVGVDNHDLENIAIMRNNQDRNSVANDNDFEVCGNSDVSLENRSIVVDKTKSSSSLVTTLLNDDIISATFNRNNQSSEILPIDVSKTSSGDWSKGDCLRDKFGKRIEVS